MPTVKQPTDHLPKASTNGKQPDPDEYFSFDHDGQTYTMPNKTLDVITPGFVRTHRHDEADFLFSALEALTEVENETAEEDGEEITVNRGREVLGVIDKLPIKEWKKFQKAFQAHIGAGLGE